MGSAHRCSTDLDRKSTTSELQSPDHLVCRLLLEKKKNNQIMLAVQALIETLPKEEIVVNGNCIQSTHPMRPDQYKQDWTGHPPGVTNSEHHTTIGPISLLTPHVPTSPKL